MPGVGKTSPVRVAVVGHVEWVQFARMERVPAQGEIAHASETWEEPGGGGAVAAVQLARLAGACTFFTALGEDEFGHRARAALERLGVRVETTFRPEPQRRAFTFLDDEAERTITLLGPKLHPHAADPLPWRELAEIDAVYFCAGDAGALRAARQARVVVATARELPTLRDAAVELDAVVASADDPEELYRAHDVEPSPRLVVRTKGAGGGSYEPGGSWETAPVPGPVRDAYGAGDSFAAGLAFALSLGRPPAEALAFAARCGAEALTRRGAHGA